MAACPACGANIQHAQTEGGEHVPLEVNTEPEGERRYRIVALGPPLVVQPVRADALIDAYPDHRKECPDFQNGYPG